MCIHKVRQEGGLKCAMMLHMDRLISVPRSPMPGLRGVSVSPDETMQWSQRFGSRIGKSSAWATDKPLVSGAADAFRERP